MKVAPKNFSEVLISELEKFKCPICHDIVQNVRELPCKHLFCFDCLEAYKEQNIRKDSIVCPLCKKKIPKRKILSRDAALDSLGNFVRALCNDVKLHHGTEALNYFSRLLSEGSMCKNIFDSDEIIAQSSDEYKIPTSKHICNKSYLKESGHNSRKAPGKEEPSIDEKKKKLKPKIGLSRKQNQPSVSASVNNLYKRRTNYLDQNDQNICLLFKNKKNIIEWLNDTRNKFERYSQTQSYNSQDNSILDIDMPSISQINEKNRGKENNLINVSEFKSHSNNQKSFEHRKTQSVISSPSKKFRKLRRHSLECIYPMNDKKYQNFLDENKIENQLLMNIVENEILDVIDKEMSSEKNDMTNASFENQITEKLINVMNKEEERFLDQLENEKLENSGEPPKKNHTASNKERKSKSSWKNIKKFKKTVGEVKGPKKLNISLQSTQKSSKKDIETKFNKSHICETSNVSKMENKSVDYQEMEDYFRKTLPKMIQCNSLDMSSQQMTSENAGDVLSSRDKLKNNNSNKCVPQNQPVSEEILNHIANISNQQLRSAQDMYHEDLTTNRELAKDNESDIYVYQTQPLSAEIIDPKIDRIHYVSTLAKKLEIVLNQLIEHDKIEIEELTPLWPSIQNLFRIFSKFSDVNGFDLNQLFENKSKMKFSEKQIQTDIVSLEGFAITPTAAFRTLIEEDIATQTNNHAFDCLNFGSEKAKSNNELSGTQKETPSKNENIELKDIFTKGASVDEVPEVLILEEEIPNGNSKPVDKIVTQQQISKELSSENVSEALKNVSKNAQNTTFLTDKHNSSDERQLHSQKAVNTSPGSGILCSIPQMSSRVNRRLMYEKAIDERNDLGQNLKRMRSTNPASDCDEERPHKVKCNRFLQDDLSIQFESQSLRDTQFLKNADVVMEETAYGDFSMNHERVSHSSSRTKDILPDCKNQSSNNNTQVDNLMNYCDELIKRANKQILGSNILPGDMKVPEILSYSHKVNSYNEEYDKYKSQKLETLRTSEKIGTQDLLKHYDELIEKAGRQIGEENNQHNKTLPQISSTSRQNFLFEDVQKTGYSLKTQDLLDHCDSLIAKSTKEISNKDNKYYTVNRKNNVDSENDDEFFCENLDQLDSVLEKENNRLEKTENKLSESLFESCKEVLINSAARNESKIEEDKILETPKSRKDTRKKKRIKNNETKSKGTDPFHSSDEEIFSDVDVVDTTPQRSISFMERLSCSQLMDQNSKISLKSQTLQNLSENVMIVPPPPGFNDEMDSEEKHNSKENLPNTERESENVIPNSLSPLKFVMPSKKKTMSSGIANSEKNISQQKLPTLSQQFMKFSPIGKEKSTDLNIIEMVRQSTFSPLIIKQKTSTPVLTSTPKQKSILSYVKPKISTSQESSFKYEKSKPCIAFTRLNNAETLCVLSLCNKNLVSREDKFGPNVTHMIVSVDKQNFVKDHTIKFISAIAAGIWVVNIKWVQECLSQNAIVNEEPFEVSDITGIPSPKISRLTRLTNPLLKGFKFYIPRSFTQTSVEDVRNIIQLLQGVVVSSIDELRDKNGYIRIIICELIDTEDYTQYEEWLSSYKVLTVDINWLSLSVSRYKILSLRPHLLCSDDAIYELGYPSHLIEDVPPTLSQDVTTYD